MADLMNILEKGKKETQYDENAKQILAFKPILANILVRTVKDFEGMDPKEVEGLIEGDISVGSTPVDPGFTNEKGESGNLKIAGMNTESNITTEGVRYFDILFYVRTSDGLSKVIINVEAQKDDPAKYDVEMRGIYYASREISSQLDRDFSGQDYNAICKVYSIWICMNTSENTIQWLSITPKSLLGQPRWKEMYQVLNVIIIRMKNALDDDTEHKLHRLLGALFVTELPFEKKEDILEREFNIRMSDYGKELFGDMCNLSQGILEQGIERGEELGFIKAIRKLIDSGMSDEQIMQLLQASQNQINLAKTFVTE